MGKSLCEKKSAFLTTQKFFYHVSLSWCLFSVILPQFINIYQFYIFVASFCINFSKLLTQRQRNLLILRFLSKRVIVFFWQRSLAIFLLFSQRHREKDLFLWYAKPMTNVKDLLLCEKENNREKGRRLFYSS